MRKTQIKRILRRVATALCAVVLVCSVLSAFLLAWVQATLLNEEFFVRACNEEYLQDLKGFLVESLSGEFARYEESEEVQQRLANQCINMDAVTVCSREHLRNLYGALVHGAELKDAKYSTDHFEPFRQHVKQVSEQAGDEVDQEVLDELVQGFADRVSGEVNCFHFSLVGFSSTSLIRMANEKLFGHPTLSAIMGISFLIPVALAILSAAGMYFASNEGSPVKKGYWITTGFWVSTTLLFFPLVLFSAYDLPSRLAITESPVKSLLDSILYHLIDGIVIPVGIFFTLFTVGIGFFIVWQMRLYARKLSSAASPRASVSGLVEVEALAQVPETAQEKPAALPAGSGEQEACNNDEPAEKQEEAPEEEQEEAPAPCEEETTEENQ